MPRDLLPAGAEPNLDSFVLRFVRSGDPLSAGAGAGAATPASGMQSVSWHGVIRHVQSNRERSFSRWADAVAFISEFVDVRAHDLRAKDVRAHDVQESQDE